MNQAKLVLSAIAIFAVIGGAFAFKASKFGNGNVYTAYTTVDEVPFCSRVLTLSTTAAPAGAQSTIYLGTLTGSICTNITTTRITAVL